MRVNASMVAFVAIALGGGCPGVSDGEGEGAIGEGEGEGAVGEGEGEGAAGEGEGEGEGEQCPIASSCVALLACEDALSIAGAISLDDDQAAHDLYGESGPCWCGDASAAAQCGNACAVEANARNTENPGFDACNSSSPWLRAAYGGIEYTGLVRDGDGAALVVNVDTDNAFVPAGGAPFAVTPAPGREAAQIVFDAAGSLIRIDSFAIDGRDENAIAASGSSAGTCVLVEEIIPNGANPVHTLLLRRSNPNGFLWQTAASHTLSPDDVISVAAADNGGCAITQFPHEDIVWLVGFTAPASRLTTAFFNSDGSFAWAKAASATSATSSHAPRVTLGGGDVVVTGLLDSGRLTMPGGALVDAQTAPTAYVARFTVANGAPDGTAHIRGVDGVPIAIPFSNGLALALSATAATYVDPNATVTALSDATTPSAYVVTVDASLALIAHEAVSGAAGSIVAPTAFVPTANGALLGVTSTAGLFGATSSGGIDAYGIAIASSPGLTSTPSFMLRSAADDVIKDVIVVGGREVVGGATLPDASTFSGTTLPEPDGIPPPSATIAITASSDDLPIP